MIEIKRNDIVLRDQDRWLHFSAPYRIIHAEKLDEVIPALQEVESLVNGNCWHAAGFLSYESAPAFDSALLTKPLSEFPYLWFGLYPEPRSVNLPDPAESKQPLNWQPTIDRDSYNAAILFAPSTRSKQSCRIP
jgi:para-aminobenzoate synthetase/4-amino-4-deoxychorismate lyase